MPYRRRHPLALVVAAIIGVVLFDSNARGQDAAWEGLIASGRNALQQQNFFEAERHFESALEAAERFPSSDARLGKSYNNLAAVYYAQEDYTRAEPLMRRALTQLRESLGPENTEVAQTMKNLAALYYLQGNRSEAETLLKQSLQILEEVHGPNHAFVATVLSNLAGLYQAEDRYLDAEPLLARSLAIWESLLGTDHPDVVKSRSLLAKIRQAQGGGVAPRAVAVSPKASTTPGTTPAADDESQAPKTEARNEIDQAKAALERLARVSKAEADLARAAEGVPVPALSPVGPVPSPVAEVADAEVDAALPADKARASGTSAAIGGQGGSGQAPGDIATSVLGEVNAAAEQTVAATTILSKAASVDDVSFAVYLSTLWSIDEARRYWQAMQDAMPDILLGKRMEIEEVAAGDGADPFYRVLTTPFSSDPEARAICKQIKSKLRTHDCNVVVRDTTSEG